MRPVHAVEAPLRQVRQRRQLWVGISARPAHAGSRNKFKLFLAAVVVVVYGVLDVARFLLTQVHDFWVFLHHLQWSR